MLSNLNGLISQNDMNERKAFAILLIKPQYFNNQRTDLSGKSKQKKIFNSMSHA